MTWIDGTLPGLWHKRIVQTVSWKLYTISHWRWSKQKGIFAVHYVKHYNTKPNWMSAQLWKWCPWTWEVCTILYLLLLVDYIKIYKMLGIPSINKMDGSVDILHKLTKPCRTYNRSTLDDHEHARVHTWPAASASLFSADTRSPLASSTIL